MATPKEQVANISELYTGIWYVYSKCNYIGCSEIVYGDEDSVIISKVFCKCHYRQIGEFLNSYGNT